MHSDKPRVGGIVQARMGSSRLPGKVLREIAGRSVVQYVLERLQRCRRLDEIVVATSTHEDDDPLAAHCRRLGVEVYRGDLHDVAKRFLGVIDSFGFDAFVRISGDSPLLDPQLVDEAVERYAGSSFDVVTNLMPRSYPKGQSVEVVNSTAFRAACGAMETVEQREHVTRFFYERCEEFRILNLSAPRDMSDIRLTVDTEEDWARFTGIVGRFERPHWQYGLAEIIEIHESLDVCREASI